MKKGEVKIKKNMSAEAVGSILDDLIGSFKEGTVCVESGGEFVVLKPSELIEVEIEASRKKNKEKLVIELNWRETIPLAEPEADFKISSTEPEPVELEETEVEEKPE